MVSMKSGTLGFILNIGNVKTNTVLVLSILLTDSGATMDWSCAI